MKYDVKKILEDADCREVAEYIGMDMKGNRCECVNEDHYEGSRLTHAVVYPTRFYCFSCHASYNAIDMVMHYHNKCLSPISFAEACGIVGDACGGRDMYLTGDDAAEQTKTFPLTKEECALIGLPLESKWKPTYEGEKKPHMNLKILFTEDEEAFKFLVAGKAKEFDERNRHCAEVCDTSLEMGRSLKKAFEDNAAKCRDICRRFGGEPRAVNPYSF